jgi:hypothetical protein
MRARKRIAAMSHQVDIQRGALHWRFS